MEVETRDRGVEKVCEELDLALADEARFGGAFKCSLNLVHFVEEMYETAAKIGNVP
jgi:hypothetical protein